MSSIEFTEWIAFWRLEAEQQGAEPDRLPTQDELGAKIAAFAARHNASQAGKAKR